MALPSSGPLSGSQIATELGAASTNISLRSLSSTAGFSIPDAISEFYSYSHANFPATMSSGVDALGDLVWHGYYSASISPQSVPNVQLPDGSGGFGSIDSTTDSVLDNNTVASILWYGDYNPGLFPPFILSEEVSLVLKGTSTEVTTWNTMSIQSGSTVSEYYRDQATEFESGSFTMGGSGTDDFLIYSWDVNFDTDGGPIGTGDAIIDFLP